MIMLQSSLHFRVGNFVPSCYLSHGIYNLFLRMYIFVKEESLITNYGALKKHKMVQISTFNV